MLRAIEFCQSLSICSGIISKRMHISSNFSIIALVFLHPNAVTNSKGKVFSGGVKFIGLRKICDFRPKSQFILETIRDRPMITMNQ